MAPRGHGVVSSKLPLIRRADIDWRVVEGEAILLDLEEAEVLRLNRMAAELWTLIDGTRSVDDLARHLERTYDVSGWRARRDVRRFVRRLRRRDFVRPMEAARR